MNRLRSIHVAAIALAVTALGADTPLQTVNVGGVKFDAPKAWTFTKPNRPMRIAELKAQPVEGDTDPAELVLTAIRGGGGGLQANLDRWKSQFQGADGAPVEIKSEKRKGKNVDVTFVEASGRYVAAMTPGSPEKFDKPNWRLLGVIVQGGDTGYYFKMVGPDKTMKAAKADFEAMIKTIAVEDK